MSSSQLIINVEVFASIYKIKLEQRVNMEESRSNRKKRKRGNETDHVYEWLESSNNIKGLTLCLLINYFLKKLSTKKIPFTDFLNLRLGLNFFLSQKNIPFKYTRMMEPTLIPAKHKIFDS
jgi:hypothetical protein